MNCLVAYTLPFIYLKFRLTEQHLAPAETEMVAFDLDLSSVFFRICLRLPVTSLKFRFYPDISQYPLGI